MKRHLFFAASLIAITIAFSFIINDNSPLKLSEYNKKVSKLYSKDPCSCNTPTVLSVNYSGSYVTITWSSVSGAAEYSWGGYYSGGSGFSGCTSGTSATFLTSGGGTFRVRAICEGTCTSATCSSSPSNPPTIF
ncbi:MAG: hypothetical protein SFU87_01085 [Chitinophagaceae bacterium]|nr:hypothetical protein [Chitinophagaceae bacterium]